MTELQSIIEKAWDNRELLQEETTINAIRKVVDLLDAGDMSQFVPIGNYREEYLFIGPNGEI